MFIGCVKRLGVYSYGMEQLILIADDHPLFREALTLIVSSACPGSVIRHAINYDETKTQLAEHHFQLAFVDLNMPDSNGLTDLAMLKKLYPQVPIVVVSAHEEADIIRSCLNHNASGYIVKSSSPDEIKAAIHAVLIGDICTPPNIDLDDNESSQAESDIALKINSLTPSQLKILIEIGKGKLNKQIAYDLGISEGTVKAHITSVFKRLGINNRTQAVLITQQHKAQMPKLDGI